MSHQVLRDKRWIASNSAACTIDARKPEVIDHPRKLSLRIHGISRPSADFSFRKKHVMWDEAIWHCHVSSPKDPLWFHPILLLLGVDPGMYPNVKIAGT